MTWLLKLYPPRWRRRYGDEFRTLIDAQGFSLANTIDVIARAIDAWIDPQKMKLEGDEKMNAKSLFRCSGYGPQVTKADTWKSLTIMLGGTLVLTLAWMWLHLRTDDNAYVDAFSFMPFLVPVLLSMRYTSLKGRSSATQAIFIGGNIVILTLIFLVSGWITTKI